MVHQRWVKGQAGVAVTFTEDMKLTMKKANFLPIAAVYRHASHRRCRCAHCTESSEISHIVLVGEDTDLCCHASLNSHNIFFRPEPKKNTKKPKVWNVKAVKEQLGPEICSNILFLHAVLGCDTTSHLYGIGKGTSLKKFKSSQEQAKVFATESATHKEISSLESLSAL